MLGPMPRTPTSDPDIAPLRMLVNDEVLVGSVLQLANMCRHHRLTEVVNATETVKGFN